MLKVKGKNLKSSKRKAVTLQRSSHKNVSYFLKRNFAGWKGLIRHIQSHEKQEPTAKIALPSKAII